VAAFELWRLEIFWKTNLDQTAGIPKNNLNWKGFNKVKLDFVMLEDNGPKVES
jgi:hypothetical protein